MPSVVDYLAEQGNTSLLASWDDPADPAAVSAGSRRRIRWRCENGHSWEAMAFSRVMNGAGCPFCAGRRPIPGETDLAATHPDLAAEWDTEKNAAGPDRVTAGTVLNAWWRCPEGHSYQAAIYSRAAGTGCPYCAGKKVLAGFNDLLTTDPALCIQWDGEKNSLTPAQVNRGSHTKIWWRCEKGHSYQAEVFARAAGNGCPYCAGKRVLAGFNDLATTNPETARQWAQDLNGGITPQMVSKGSNKKFWWRCSEGHVWKAAVFSRTRKRASDCPVCAGTVKQAQKTAPAYRRAREGERSRAAI